MKIIDLKKYDEKIVSTSKYLKLKSDPNVKIISSEVMLEDYSTMITSFSNLSNNFRTPKIKIVLEESNYELSLSCAEGIRNKE